jgi:hypothetical protein
VKGGTSATRGLPPRSGTGQALRSASPFSPPAARPTDARRRNPAHPGFRNPAVPPTPPQPNRAPNARFQGPQTGFKLQKEDHALPDEIYRNTTAHSGLFMCSASQALKGRHIAAPGEGRNDRNPGSSAAPRNRASAPLRFTVQPTRSPPDKRPTQESRTPSLPEPSGPANSTTRSPSIPDAGWIEANLLH